jgi:prephenate dehydratase
MVKTDTTITAERPYHEEGAPLPTIAYLSPNGNFTHLAAVEMQQKQPRYENTRLLGFSTIDSMFESIASGGVKYALVPVENSTDGAVPKTHTNLYEREGLQIVDEFVLDVAQTLYYQDLSQVEIVASKDSALGQCRKNLRKKFAGRNIELVEMESTGMAIQEAARNPKVAALGSSIFAEVNGLTGILTQEDNFNDREDNKTTFALVQLAGELPPPTGNDKTTFTMTIPDSQGSLVHALDILAQNNVDLNKIKSIGRDDGTVTFLMSADGHLRDGVMQEALIALENDSEREIKVKRLGSYAKAAYNSTESAAEYDFDAAIERINGEAKNGDEMDKSKMIAVFTLKDHPGALRDALRPFAAAGVNLTKIDSQPSGIHNEHIFYIAFERNTENIESILDEFKTQCHFHKVIPGGGAAL